MIQSQRKTRRKSVQSTSAAPIESEDNTALARALSGIVASRASARAKLDQIESLIAKPGKSSLPIRKKGNNPPTDDNSVRGQLGKLRREFNQIDTGGDNSFGASISGKYNASVDIEQGLESLLIAHNVKPRKVRDDLVRTFASLVERARTGEDISHFVAAANVSPSAPPLPEKAPKLYSDRADRSMNILEFLMDSSGWGPWVRHGALSRPDLKRLDFNGYVALQNWLKKNTLPEGVEIPTRSESIDRLLQSGHVPASSVEKLARTLAKRRRRSRRALNP